MEILMASETGPQNILLKQEYLISVIPIKNNLISKVRGGTVTYLVDGIRYIFNCGILPIYI